MKDIQLKTIGWEQVAGSGYMTDRKACVDHWVELGRQLAETTETDEGSSSDSMQAKDGWDLRQLQKLSSIRDIMNRERCFSMEKRTSTLRGVMTIEEEFSMENVFEAFVFFVVFFACSVLVV